MRPVQGSVNVFRAHDACLAWTLPITACVLELPTVDVQETVDYWQCTLTDSSVSAAALSDLLDTWPASLLQWPAVQLDSVPPPTRHRQPTAGKDVKVGGVKFKAITAKIQKSLKRKAEGAAMASAAAKKTKTSHEIQPADDLFTRTSKVKCW